MPLVDALLKPDEEVGLIRTAPNDDAVTGYSADEIQFDDGRDSVISLVDQVIAKNSTPQQRAEARAIASANRRGLSDSTMAVEAGQAAIYDYAVPIATTEAGNRLTVKGQNAQAVNAARGQLAGAQNQSRGIVQQTRAEQELLGTKAAIDSRLAGEQAGHERALIETRGAEEMKLADAGRSHDVVLAGIDRQTQEALQTLRGQQALDVTALEQNFRSLQQMTETGGQMYMSMTQGIAEILSQPDITVDNKHQLVNRVLEAGRGAFNFMSVLNNVDLSDYINESFGTAVGGAAGSPPSDGKPSWWPPGIPYSPFDPGQAPGVA